jgi:hypothetical protein
VILWKHKTSDESAAVIGGPIAVALFVVVARGLVMLLWNWLRPPLFDFPPITSDAPVLVWRIRRSGGVRMGPFP